MIVAAAGNDSLNTDTCQFLPAAMASKYDNIVSVAALNTKMDKLASFSNFGLGNINIAAPGEAIKVIDEQGNDQIVKGTSFSTPFIAVLAAMAKIKSGESAKDIADKIKARADNIGAQLTTQGKIDPGNFVEILE